MTDDQKQIGKTLWNIADQLRGAMNADDFRDYGIGRDVLSHAWGLCTPTEVFSPIRSNVGRSD
jgi:hypothetical protein